MNVDRKYMFGTNLVKIRLVDQVKEPKVYFWHKFKNALKPFLIWKLIFGGLLTKLGVGLGFQNDFLCL